VQFKKLDADVRKCIVWQSTGTNINLQPKTFFLITN